MIIGLKYKIRNKMIRKLFIGVAILLMASPFKVNSQNVGELKEGVFVQKSGVRYSYSGKTFTEIYSILTDSVVYRFGLEFKSSDSSFVRKVTLDSYDRKVYDMINRSSDTAINNQEKLSKETVEFLQRRNYRDIWILFKTYEVLKK